MFDKERFIDDCITALPDGQQAIREIVTQAVSNKRQVITALGEPAHAGIFPLYQSPELTIIHFVWAPYMSLMPHNHQMYAVIGIYSGREDNVFWRQKEERLEAAGARSLGIGDVATLGHDIIHSVFNPIGKMTSAIHVYGGDFFKPDLPRSGWDHETLTEQPWDMDQVKTLFHDAETRFNATSH